MAKTLQRMERDALISRDPTPVTGGLPDCCSRTTRGHYEASAGDPSGKLQIKITSIKKIVPGSQEVRADQGDFGGAEDGRSREGSRRSPADLVGC